MKKQYTIEDAYIGNSKVTFYEDGVRTYYTIIANYDLDGYIEAKQEDGWVEGYSQDMMEKVIEKN